MAFVITDDRVDKVTFYNILEHMDTKIKERRPNTPCKLIIPRYDTTKIFSDQ
jgi:hypothetical protein